MWWGDLPVLSLAMDSIRLHPFCAGQITGKNGDSSWSWTNLPHMKQMIGLILVKLKKCDFEERRASEYYEHLRTVL